MKLVSVDEMRRLDRMAQEDFGIDSYELMAEAGRAMAEEIDRRFGPEPVCVVCGKGNNAGDGFVAARALHELGHTVTVVCLEEETSFKGAARTAWERLVETKVTIASLDNVDLAVKECGIILDALLGTGINGNVTGSYAAVIDQLNASGKTIVSADIPSGLRELGYGEEPGAVVRANLTLTVGLPKTMLLTHPGSAYTGKLIVLPINFPPSLLESDEWQLNWAQPEDLASWLPPRQSDSNKGTYGHVGIIGSAPTYAGATVLVARAALRAGCGLATIYSLPQTNIIYKTALPEATSVLLSPAEELDETAAESFVSNHKEHTVLAVGPGLGTAPATKQFLRRVLEVWTGPLVLDADALNILSDGLLDRLKDRQDCLITPHPGEMARLTGLEVKAVQNDRVEIPRQFARDHGICVLLKGSGTVVARPDGQVWLIPGSEAALAKGGTGDVLTGAIAALFAQGIPMWQAAVLGASAHLAAGGRCARRFGSRGVLASEVADAIPLELDAIQEHNNG